MKKFVLCIAGLRKRDRLVGFGEFVSNIAQFRDLLIRYVVRVSCHLIHTSVHKFTRSYVLSLVCLVVPGVCYVMPRHGSVHKPTYSDMVVTDIGAVRDVVRLPSCNRVA